LYGKNLVVPVGYAGSEAIAGGPTFAVDPQGRLLQVTPGAGGTTSVNVITPTRFPTSFPTRTEYYYYNIDEYPVRADRESSPEVEAAFIAALSTNEDTFDPIANAQSAFEAFGIDTDQAQVETKGDLARDINKTAFGFLPYGSAASGLSQALGSLTVGNVVGQIAGNGS
jgi:hypothetical protein